MGFGGLGFGGLGFRGLGMWGLGFRGFRVYWGHLEDIGKEIGNYCMIIGFRDLGFRGVYGLGF